MTRATKAAASDAVVSGKHGAPLISDQKLLDLYASVLRGWRSDRSQGHAPAQGLSSSDSVRYEAVFAALLQDLRRHDEPTRSPALDSHGAERAHFAAQQATLDIATGMAVALRRTRPGALVTAFALREELNETAFRQTLRFAAAEHLPILYVLLPSKSESRKHAFDWSADAILEQVPCIPVDVHDAVALYRVTQESAVRARENGGPTLIDCRVVRLQPGDFDPVTRIEAHLERKGLFSARRKQQILAAIEKDLAPAPGARRSQLTHRSNASQSNLA